MPSRRLQIAWASSVGHIIGLQRRGGGDPTHRVVDGTHWRAMRTPEGPATIAVHVGADAVEAEAWGTGADWALAHLDRLLGALDRPEEFVPEDELISDLIKRHGTPRIGGTGLVWEALLPSVIEQKVTGQEAFAGFRALVRRYGEPAPGPQADLWLQPSAEVVAQIPSWEWLRLHIDPARSRTVVMAASRATALERTIGLPGDEVERRLRSLPGVGEWTAAEVRQRAHGDPDAVSFGDYHVAKNLGWALTGATWDDEQMRDHLEPFRPHRGRVVALVTRAAGIRPRRGPRMAPRTHLPG